VNNTQNRPLFFEAARRPQVVSGLADIRDEFFLEDQKL
jgi:hypothetical protein